MREEPQQVCFLPPPSVSGLVRLLETQSAHSILNLGKNHSLPSYHIALRGCSENPWPVSGFLSFTLGP